MRDPLRVVNDTNVWLSALYFSGKPAKIVDLIEKGACKSMTSDFILEELKERMVIDFHTPSFAANTTISYIKSISELVSLKGTVFGLRDLDDNKVLETAVVGECKWLVTGDRDLLDFGKYKNIQIVTPAQFLTQFKIHQ